MALLMKPPSSSLCQYPVSLEKEEEEEEVLRHDDTDDDESEPSLSITILSFQSHLLPVVVVLFVLIDDHFLVVSFTIYFRLCIEYLS